MEPYLDNPPYEPDPQAMEKARAEMENLAEETRTKRERMAPARRDAIVLLSPDVADVDAAVECDCWCHPKPADPAVHAGGVECPCQLTEDERRERSRAAMEELSQYADYQAEVGAEDEYRDRVVKAARVLGATVDTFLPAAPFVVAGVVDGHTFYLRERHDSWRVVVAGEDNPLLSVWDNTPADALVIAEGTTSGWDWTGTQMVTDAIRMVKDFLRARACPHTDAKEWCPDCGARMADK